MARRWRSSRTSAPTRPSPPSCGPGTWAATSPAWSATAWRPPIPGAVALYVQGACGDVNFLREFTAPDRCRRAGAAAGRAGPHRPGSGRGDGRSGRGVRQRDGRRSRPADGRARRLEARSPRGRAPPGRGRHRGLARDDRPRDDQSPRRHGPSARRRRAQGRAGDVPVPPRMDGSDAPRLRDPARDARDRGAGPPHRRPVLRRQRLRVLLALRARRPPAVPASPS